jgi:hypothetical protein
MDFAGGRTWLLLVVVVVAYAGAWSAGLVWDDVPLVVQNPTLNSLANLPVFFTGDLWAGSGAMTARFLASLYRATICTTWCGTSPQF